jgi:hypothetical protein
MPARSTQPRLAGIFAGAATHAASQPDDVGVDGTLCRPSRQEGKDAYFTW